MSELFHWLLGPWSSIGLLDAVAALKALALSGNKYFYLVLVFFVRFDLAPLVTWAAYLVRPRAFEPPPVPAGFRPLVSVVIAGRNPGAGIAATIRSVLSSDYENVEIVYVDDASTDDSVAQARAFETGGGRVRVFAVAQHNGKSGNLNIGLSMARGELIFVLDSDVEIAPGCIDAFVAYFTDPRVGGVSGDTFIRNASASLLARFVAIEFANNASLARIWRSQLGVLNILPGAASMFRASALHALGGYDSGLGDDTDMTIRLQKQGWRLRFSVRAVNYSDTPAGVWGLMRQRSRWTRNSVKVRIRKHLDMATGRFGMKNALICWDYLIFRIGLGLLGMGAVLFALLFAPAARPELVSGLYWYTAFFLLVKVLIINDIAGTPPLRYLPLVLLYPIYRLPIRIAEDVAIVRELLHIAPYHPYVPRRIWNATNKR